MKSPLKYHGGKSYLAKQIVSIMPPHRNYVEPFFGGGSVLLEKDPANTAEVINDVWGGLTNFWVCLQDPSLFDEMYKILQVTPFSEDEFLSAKNDADFDSVIAAVRFFIRARQSLAGRGDTFSPITTKRLRRGMNEQVSAWLSAIEGLPAVHKRMQRVLILNRPAVRVIDGLDDPGTLFYLDPPYMGETRAAKSVYQFEMDENDHSELLMSLIGIQGKFILSGYRSDLYDGVAEAQGWTRIDIDVPNNAAGGAEKRRMTECLWVNYPIQFPVVS